MKVNISSPRMHNVFIEVKFGVWLHYVVLLFFFFGESYPKITRAKVYWALNTSEQKYDVLTLYAMHFHEHLG